MFAEVDILEWNSLESEKDYLWRLKTFITTDNNLS